MGLPTYRVRIVLVCILSFLIVHYGTSRYYQDPTFFNTVRLTGDLQTIGSSIASIKLPAVAFPVFTAQNSEATPTPDPIAYEVEWNTIESRVEIQESEVNTVPPTSPPSVVIPTTPLLPTTPPRLSPTTIPLPSPTQPPQPTKTPKPTKGPDLFPIDPSKRRPGETVDEIIALAAQKACAPKEVLRTLASIESGGFFDTVIPKYLLLYNSEGWWSSEFITDNDEGRKRVCSGYSYDSNTGLIFGDAKHAGARCRDGSNSGLTTAGVMHLSTYLNNHYKDKAAKLIGSKNVDRRIIFDALVMAGLNIKENTKATTCTNWDARTVVKAACSYYGSCGTKDGTYYCATFCRNYQKYGGKDCSGAIKEFTETCWK